MARNVYDRAAIVDENFVEFCRTWDRRPFRAIDPGERVQGDAPLTGAELLDVFHSQVVSRHLDLTSRAMRARNEGFYTIGSSGHEGNAVLGLLTRETDPALLHYRSGGFMVQRAKKDPAIDIVRDTLLGLAASREDPVAGGRHKVWGSRPLWVLPQTSTIASHLPKAVGTAIAIRRTVKLGLEPPVPRDAIVVCSFGDASLNHSTALGAFSAAARAVYQQVACPILFVCEDNGLGISVRTPAGWVEDAFRKRPGLRYFQADGLDPVDAHRVAREAIATCRSQRRPVFLHLKVVRLMGHAGTDVELEYRPVAEVEAAEAMDPVRVGAERILKAGLMTADDILDLYESVRAEVAEKAADAVGTPRLATAEEVLRPLAPYSPEAVADEARRTPARSDRVEMFGGEDRLPESGKPLHLAASINAALHDLMLAYPESILFGEDVAQKGGVYNVTARLLARFQQSRVFNTILDETSILGIAQGFAYMGLLPIPEIQYLAYFHNACDQIRGEACSMQFFSNDAFRNPMVLRIASLAYQKGFGGHFHNDNSVAALRDIPGIVLACPSRGDDAAGMLRTCAALAKVDGRVVAFLEPIALYMARDLHEERDGAWLTAYPPPGEAVALGAGRAYHEDATDVAVVTYGNGVPMALRAARRLAEEDGVRARVLDVRWLRPLPEAWIGEHARACGRVVVLDEGRRTGGVGEAMVTAVVEQAGAGIPVVRIAGEDTYIPLGPAANLVLPSVDGVVAGCRRLLGDDAPNARRPG